MIDEQNMAQEIIEQAPENESHVTQEQQPKLTGNQKNFAALREKAERLQRERDEAINYIKSLQEQGNSTKQDSLEEDNFNEIDPEELAAGKHINKVVSKIKKLENELNTYKQHSQESITEARIKSKYADFDDVVSVQNVESLKNLYPELWSTINSNNDLYNKAVSAYTLIKNLGLMAPDYTQEKTVVNKNFNKPRNSAMVGPQLGDTPLTKANAFENGLTEELKKQLYKEMIEASRKTY